MWSAHADPDVPQCCENPVPRVDKQKAHFIYDSMFGWHLDLYNLMQSFRILRIYPLHGRTSFQRFDFEHWIEWRAQNDLYWTRNTEFRILNWVLSVLTWDFTYWAWFATVTLSLFFHLFTTHMNVRPQTDVLFEMEIVQVSRKPAVMNLNDTFISPHKGSLSFPVCCINHHAEKKKIYLAVFFSKFKHKSRYFVCDIQANMHS